VTDHLTDIASDLSAFHRIDDPGEMESAVFFALAYRLPAYSGAMAAVAARQAQEQGGSAGRGRAAPRYERNSSAANNARTAEAAPVATAAALASANAQLGGGWISHRTVKADPAPGQSISRNAFEGGEL
jgi:hypothetical protein